MAKKVKWNKDGFQELRNAPKVREFVHDLAVQVANDASDGGKIEGYIVTDLLLEEERAATSVMATGKAGAHNRKTHALIKALDAARE